MSTKFEQRITLDFTVTRIQNIHCSQDDCNSRSILITLSDNGKPYKLPQSDILCIKISKPDRTFVYMDDDDTHVSRNDDGTISLILPEQATCVPGKCDAEIKIISENSTVTTAQDRSRAGRTWKRAECHDKRPNADLHRIPGP